MDAAHRRARYDLDEYVALENYSNVKHEFLDGEIRAMTGGTPEHGALAVRTTAALLSQLRGRRCTVFNSDVRVRTTTGLDTYPDGSVVCGTVERDTGDSNAVTNPVVLVEVTSKSTEDYDRGEKLEHYKSIPSVREVVFVSHRDAVIEIVERNESGSCVTRAARRGERIELRSIGCTLEVDEVYLDPLAA